MANKKITELDAITELTDDDLLVVIDDVAGTPTTKKITKANALTGYSKTDHNHSLTYEPVKSADDNYVTDAEKTALHDHANKATLDTYNQTNANLTDAVSKKHAHANSVALDAVSGVNTGDQNLSGLDTYEAVVAVSGGDYTTVGAAIAAGKKSIFLKDGTYTETDSLTMGVDCNIVGESRNAIINLNNHSVTMSNNSTLKNCTITNWSATGITANGTYNMIIGCKFLSTASYFDHPLRLEGAARALVKDNLFYNDTASTVTRFISDATAACSGIIQSNYFYGKFTGAIVMNNDSVIRILDNYFHSTSSDSGDFATIKLNVNISMHDTLISGNYIQGAGHGHGIYLDGPSNVTISNNNLAVYATATAIKLVAADNTLVTGNYVITGSVGLSIDSACSGVRYGGNHFEQATTTVDDASADAVCTDAGSLDLSGYALKTNVLELDNTSAFTPDTDYEPATKKYVDDAVTASGGYTDEMAQDAVGGMVTGNTESGITVEYDDANAKLNFTVASQTDNNYTTAEKNKLAGVEAGAEVNNISDANATDLTDSGATTLHKHSYNNLDDKPTIPTGDLVNDTTPQLGGDLDLNDKYVAYKEAPTADHTASGIIVSMTAGETLVAGDIVYFKSDGKVWKADANGAGMYPAMGISLSGVNADASANILLNGIFRDDTYTLTVGGVVYLSTTAGGVTQTQPTATDEVIQVLGIATHADRFYFNPQLDYITHT